MGRGHRIMMIGDQGTDRLDEIERKHEKEIAAGLAMAFKTHTIDETDAAVAIAHGGLRMLKQLARTATPDISVWVWSGGQSTVSCETVRLQEHDDLRMHLQDGRIGSYVRRGEELWSNGSLLVGRDVQMPAALVAAIPGRRLDDIVEGSMLAGRGLTVKKAWNVGKSLGMTFGNRMIDVHEALAKFAPAQRAA